MRTMMLKCRLLVLQVALVATLQPEVQVFGSKDGDEDIDFYSHTVKDIHGNEVSLEKYRGKVSLVVNVASECGFTDGHYKGLVRLHKLFSVSQKFNVLGFPCNQFSGQEPGTEAQILKFTQDRYHVNFPLFAKTNVLDDEITGEASPPWKYITKNGVAPTWNFWKYLIDPDGKVISYFGPWSDIEEITPHVRKAVDDALNAKGPRRPPGLKILQNHEAYMEGGEQNHNDGTPGTDPSLPSRARLLNEDL